MIITASEPGTDLQLHLGDEVLNLAPQTTLQIILSNVVIMVIAVYNLRLSEDFLFPADSLWLQRMSVDTMWEFNIEDKSCFSPESRGCACFMCRRCGRLY